MVLNYSARVRSSLLRRIITSCLVVILVAAAYTFLAPLNSPDVLLDRLNPYWPYIIVAGAGIVLFAGLAMRKALP
jgi:hypothetical protein